MSLTLEISPVLILYGCFRFKYNINGAQGWDKCGQHNRKTSGSQEFESSQAGQSPWGRDQGALS